MLLRCRLARVGGRSSSRHLVPQRRSFGLDSPVGAAAATLEMAQASTGLPWWAVAAGTAVTIRLCLLPLTVYGMRSHAPLGAAVRSKAVADAKREHDAAVKAGGRRQQTLLHLVRVFWREKRKHGGSLVKPFLPVLVHIPVLVSVSLALKDLAMSNPGFASPGPLGLLDDISVADPTWTLPMIHVCLLTINSEIGFPNVQPYLAIKRAIQAAVLMSMYPIVQYTPAGLLMYWLASGLWTSAQIAAFRQPWVLRMVMPKARRLMTPQDPATAGMALASGQGVSSRIAARAMSGSNETLREFSKRFDLRDTSEETRAQMSTFLRQAHEEGRTPERLVPVPMKTPAGPLFKLTTAEEKRKLAAKMQHALMLQARDEDLRRLNEVYVPKHSQDGPAAPQRVEALNHELQDAFESGDLFHRYEATLTAEDGPDQAKNVGVEIQMKLSDGDGVQKRLLHYYAPDSLAEDSLQQLSKEQVQDQLFLLVARGRAEGNPGTNG